MKEVAKIANVSVATVSNVLSGNKYVSPKLKKRVTKAIEELNYRPSKLARSLKLKRTFQLGLLIPDITNPYFAEVARGVESIALQNGYQMFLCNTDGEATRELSIIHSFIDQHVDGIINVAPRLNENKMLKATDNRPMVILDRHLSFTNPLIDVIYTNNFKGSAELAEHFLKNGHNLFACIAGPKNVPTAVRRMEGFNRALIESGIPASRNHIFYGSFKFNDGYEMMLRIMNLNPRPTVVFAGNDMMAWGALEAAKEANLKIPEDIAIAGFDNVYFSQFVVPALTTVHQPKFEAGQLAMNILLEKIENKLANKQLEAKKLELDTTLIIRNSSVNKKSKRRSSYENQGNTSQ
ncbi:MAG: LacI family DNA-binding transcriptional regulator [Thermotogota bacterium]|nr:LacI family DNA-binding transcriptional regulator [Thermotogota bacterium]